MAVVLYANNASSTLAGSLTNVSTSCTLSTGTGTLFPSPGAGQYFVMTFSDAATNLVREIVHVTARSGDVCTIVRAQEGTTARSWSVADNAQNLWTAGAADSLAQTSQIQIQADNYGVDSGSANALVITLSLAPVSLASIVGSPIRILKTGTANTGAVTLNVNALGARPVTMPGGAALNSGVLPASALFTLIYDGSEFQLQGGFLTPRTGELFSWTAPSAPAYALVRDGSAVSRAVYFGLNALASAAGYSDPWGPGNGTTTFNVPNDLGVFDRGWDSGGAIDPGRAFGSLQTDAFRSHAHDLPVYVSDSSSSFAADGSGTTLHTATTNATGGAETRPINRAYLPCICI